MYSALQILTASAASFIHGANDVSNSVGPFTTAWHVWRTGEIPNHVGVPIWILAVGGLGIVVGLLTYGYHVMRNLGNRLTLISPSRGFCMELGSAITILIATRLSLPVSTVRQEVLAEAGRILTGEHRRNALLELSSVLVSRMATGDASTLVL
jgi:sodium-dependent phosphate transporter